jgi:hypothetical protein
MFGSWRCTADCVGQCLGPGSASGAVPDRAPGPPLLVSKTGGLLKLTWGASCVASDTNYEVYEGVLGNFASHVPVVCSTDSTSATITPRLGNAYYLIVPTSGIVDGSYGQSSSGLERPQGPATCHVQSIYPCPH